MVETRKQLKVNLIILLMYFLIICALYQFQVPCIFLYVTGYPCPGCGMTRAMIFAMHFRFYNAFQEHGMFWVMPLVAWLLLHPRKFSHLRWKTGFWIFCGTGFMVNWIIHLIEILC